MLPQHTEQIGRTEGAGALKPSAAPSLGTWPAVDRRRAARAPGQAPRGVYTLRALVEMMRRRRMVMAAALLLVFGVACAVTVILPRRFEAEAKLMVRRARAEAPVTLERGTAATVPAEMSESELNAEIELLRSRDLLEEVAVASKLVIEQPSEDHREAVARAVRKLDANLRVGPIGKTNLISVVYKSADPEESARVVNCLMDGYLRKHVAVHRSADAAGFFKTQATSFEKELAQAQQSLADFRRKDEVSNLTEQKSSTLRRVSELEAAAQESESGIRDAENRAHLLRQQLASLPATIETGSRTARSLGLIERLKGQLLELENKRTELLTKYEPGYRLVRETEQQIQDTRAALDREQSPSVVDRTHAPNPLRQSIEGDLLRAETNIAGLRARRASLLGDLAGTRARLARLDTLTGTHDDLERRQKMAEESYLLYQKKEEESRLEQALDQQRILNVSVVEKAEVPADPAPRHRSLILVIGLFAGLFAALATGFVADYFLEAPAPARSAATLSPALLTTPVTARSVPVPPLPKSPEKRAPRQPTNDDRASFVAAGFERQRTSGMGMRTASAAVSFQPVMTATAPAMPPQPRPQTRPASAPPRPTGFTGDYTGSSVRRLFMD